MGISIVSKNISYKKTAFRDYIITKINQNPNKCNKQVGINWRVQQQQQQQQRLIPLGGVGYMDQLPP